MHVAGFHSENKKPRPKKSMTRNRQVVRCTTLCTDFGRTCGGSYQPSRQQAPTENGNKLDVFILFMEHGSA